nr:1-deoxy-D-xylulose-5-phosphate synthase N-terminal domain-containing protein [Tessaracoccus coleopterorum]
MTGDDRTVVAVIGDGALTGGMAWEALNNIADNDDLRLVVIVNDNGRSYTPTVGASPITSPVCAPTIATRRPSPSSSVA